MATVIYGTVTDKDIEQAIYNCYPTMLDKLHAIIYRNRHGVMPFNPQLN